MHPILTTAKYVVIGAVVVGVVSGVKVVIIVVGGSIVFPVVVIVVVAVVCDVSSLRLCSTKLLSSVMLTSKDSKIGLYLTIVALFSSIA